MRASFTSGFDSNPAGYLRELERAVACYQRAGDVCRSCLEQSNIGHAQTKLGLYEQAVATLRAALTIAENLSLTYVVDGAKQHLGIALAHTGHLVEAAVLARETAESYEQRGHLRLAASSRRYLTTIHLLEGNLIQAGTEAHATLKSSPRHSMMRAQSRAMVARVLLARAWEQNEAFGDNFEETLPDSTVTDGDLGNRAFEQADAAMRRLRKLGGMDEGEALIRLVYAESLYQVFKFTDARKAIVEARDRLHERAARIDRKDWRESFLYNIPVHARTLKLAENWT